jgi:electron transport complex protein RnfC
MIKNPFFGLGKPQLQYDRLPPRLREPEFIPAASTVTLLHRRIEAHKAPAGLRIGDTVKTGQKLALAAEPSDYVIATASGTVKAMAPVAGDFGRLYTAVTVSVAAEEAVDGEFAAAAGQPSRETLRGFLAALPGMSPSNWLAAAEPPPFKMLVVCGIDQDLRVLTNQYVMQARRHEIERGIGVLKQILGVEDAVILTPKETVQGYGHIGGRVVGVDSLYPSALPPLVMAKVFGLEVPAGRTCEDLGFCFMTAEAVAAVGSAFTSGRIPVKKVLTVILKDGVSRLVEVLIGTPVGDILNTFGVQLAAGDRLIFGGPMRGAAAYTLEQPIRPDTDAIMVLAAHQAAESTPYPCINCGECIRACPARIQVNLLVRYLEAGKFEDGAEYYDLYSCLECGLCSFVCVSKIPIGQYISLAKHELARVHSTEASNA